MLRIVAAVFTIVILTLPTTARASIIFDFAIDVNGATSGNQITAFGDIHFAGDLSMDGLFPIATNDIVDVNLTFQCTQITAVACFPDTVFDINDLTFVDEYSVRLGELSVLDMRFDLPGIAVVFGSFFPDESRDRLTIQTPVDNGTTCAFQLACPGTYSLTRVPEPATLTLVGAGLAGLAFFRRREQRT